MPALITHHIFGERAARALPEGIVSGGEELQAFLVGNQGPDPLFFRWRGPLSQCLDCGRIASGLHASGMGRSFSWLRESVSHLALDDQGIGRSFALGMLAHYLLDRTTHPFVYAQENRIVSFSDELADAHGPVHAIVEGDLDVMMLWRERRATVATERPAAELAHTPRVALVGGALVSQMVAGGLSRRIAPTRYGECLDDMQLFYRRCEPMGAPLSVALGHAERLVRPHSRIQAMSHRVVSDGECPWANDDREPWRSPFDGSVSREGFVDLFDSALRAWPALAHAFVAGEPIERITRGIDYRGRIVDGRG